MATVTLKAHTALQSKRYVHNGVDVGDAWTAVELTDEVTATLREFSSGRILAQPTEANARALAAVGLGLDVGGVISVAGAEKPEEPEAEQEPMPRGRGRAMGPR